MSDQSHGPEGSGPAHGHEEAHHVEDSLHVERWEGIWMRATTVMVVVFVLAIIVSATAFGITVPGVSGRIDPATLNDPGSPFANPGLRELAPGKYEAYMVAQTWNFLPDKMEVPVGSEVTFHLTARDVTHGMKLAGTNVNMMALPGQISTLSAKFDKPGVYNYICHEYCGYVAGAPIGHQTMYGQLTVVATDTLTATGTITETAPMTDTAPVTETAPATATETVTETAPVTDTVTETAPLTETAPVTETAPAAAGTVTEPAVVTETVIVTEVVVVTQTVPVTATATVTTTAP
jgi:cytochrome c oxidase subunit 2